MSRLCLDPVLRKICEELDKNAENFNRVKELLKKCDETLREFDSQFFVSDYEANQYLKYADNLLGDAVFCLKRLLINLLLFLRL